MSVNSQVGGGVKGGVGNATEFRSILRLILSKNPLLFLYFNLRTGVDPPPLYGQGVSRLLFFRSLKYLLWVLNTGLKLLQICLQHKLKTIYRLHVFKLELNALLSTLKQGPALQICVY